MEEIPKVGIHSSKVFGKQRSGAKEPRVSMSSTAAQGHQNITSCSMYSTTGSSGVQNGMDKTEGRALSINLEENHGRHSLVAQSLPSTHEALS